MERQATLLLRAAYTQRKLWASLPFNLRLAELFRRLAVDPKETFGRIVYTAFVQRKVEGLPDINGQPALEFDLTRAPQKLVPAGYGKDFGTKAMNIVSKKYKNSEMVQDALQDVSLTFMTQPERLREGVSLREAQNYVLTCVENACKIALRNRQRHPGDYGLDTAPWDDDDKGMAHELEDPDSLKDIMSWIVQDAREDLFPKLMRELSRIPGAVPYVEGVLKYGLPDSNLVGREDKGIEAMIPWFQEHPMSYGNFSVNLKPKIKKVLKKHLDSLHP